MLKNLFSFFAKRIAIFALQLLPHHKSVNRTDINHIVKQTYRPYSGYSLESICSKHFFNNVNPTFGVVVIQDYFRIFLYKI